MEGHRRGDERADEASGDDADHDTAAAIADDGGASEKKAGKPLLKRPLFWIAILVVIAALVAGGFYYWFDLRLYETTDDAFIGADIVQISPQLSGSITAAPIDTNAHVKKGDVIARIDQAAANADLQNEQAQLEEAKAQLEEAKVGVDQTKNQEAEAAAQLDALEVQARNAKDTLTRDEALAKSDASPITDKQLDDARAAARTAQAKAEGGRAMVETAKTAVRVAQAKVGSAEASVKAAESQIAATNIKLGYTVIKAPVDGQLVQKNVNLGSYVTPGNPIMAIVPDALYVTANFKETQLADIRIGQSVDIAIDAFPDIDFRGKVVSIQHGAGQAFQLLPAQNATGNFVKVVQRVPVRISIESPSPLDYPLGPGMSVVPSIKVR